MLSTTYAEPLTRGRKRMHGCLKAVDVSAHGWMCEARFTIRSGNGRCPVPRSPQTTTLASSPSPNFASPGFPSSFRPCSTPRCRQCSRKLDHDRQTIPPFVSVCLHLSSFHGCLLSRLGICAPSGDFGSIARVRRGRTFGVKLSASQYKEAFSTLAVWSTFRPCP